MSRVMLRTLNLKSVFMVHIKKSVYKNGIKVNNIYLKKYYLSPIIISCTLLGFPHLSEAVASGGSGIGYSGTGVFLWILQNF